MHEAVGIFDDPSKLDSAVAELEVTAFPRHDISVLDSSKMRPLKGGRFWSGRSFFLKDDPGAPRTVSVRPEERALGALALVGGFAYVAGCGAAILAQTHSPAALLASIALGSLCGGVLGFLVAVFFGARLRRDVKKQLDMGGILLWVRAPDREREKAAQEIMRKHGANFVEIHNMR